MIFMKTISEKKPSRGILWRILFFLLLLILFAVLELGKHTILGWVLLVLVFAAFYFLRSTKLKNTKKGIRFLSWICLLILSGIVLWISWPPVRLIPAVQAKNPVKTDLIHVAQGDLTGVVTEDKEVEVFAGIPYAKAPVGDLRWKEPQDVENWEGVNDCSYFAPRAMQAADNAFVNSFIDIFLEKQWKVNFESKPNEPMSEDCLYLNVFKPKNITAGAPVLVFFHGGSLTGGKTSNPDYRGEEFAKNGISEFTDRAGRRISINNYIKQKSLDEITKIMRNSYFMQAVKYGVPYVRIIHLNLHPHCALCEPFTNKVLALEENDKGVMTLAEANSIGLFHPYCDDVPMSMQLENDFNEDDIKINLNEENKKRKAYNKKRGFKSFFG